MSAAVSCSAAARVAPAGRLGAPQATALRPALASGRAALARAAPRARQSLAARRRAAGVASAVLEINEATWEAEVVEASKAGKPVLVDFWATWCGPCKLVAPSMVWAEKEFGDHLKVVKINVTESAKAPAVKELMERYRVYGLPCLVVFKGGEELEGSHREGAITKKGLGEYLETHLGLKPAPAA